MRRARPAAIVLALAVTATLAYAHTMERSLYSRLGGRGAITAVVDDFVTNVAKDNRINKFFADTDIPRLNWCSRFAQAPAVPASTRAAACARRTAVSVSATPTSTRWSRSS
jgi:hemoglobin